MVTYRTSSFFIFLERPGWQSHPQRLFSNHFPYEADGYRDKACESGSDVHFLGGKTTAA